MIEFGSVLSMKFNCKQTFADVQYVYNHRWESIPVQTTYHSYIMNAFCFGASFMVARFNLSNVTLQFLKPLEFENAGVCQL